MKTVLDDLFEGNIFPQEQLVPKSPEYQQTAQVIKDTLSRLKTIPGSEEAELAGALDNLITKLEGVYSRFYFIHGFKLGMKLMGAIYAHQMPNDE